MKAFRVALLASLLTATAEAAPAPVFREPRVPAPETVLARLRAEGLDVRGLMHLSGSRWVSEGGGTSDVPYDSLAPLVTPRRIITAPGDPTDALRQFLRGRARGSAAVMKRLVE